MSGGYFDYKQYHIDGIADSIAGIIERKEYSPEVMAELEKGLEIMKKAYIYAQRIDWLESGDDGEDCFLRRLKEDLSELGGQE